MTARGSVARNLEVKARDPDPAHSAEVARRLGARDCGRFWQRDTFFGVKGGRLKLREQADGARLIRYNRADVAGARASTYTITPVRDPGTTRRELAATNGILCVVEKNRHLFTLDNVRIHLDDVSSLGSYIEFEAIVPAGRCPEDERPRVLALQEAFGIRAQRLVAYAYADLLTRAADGNPRLSAATP